MPLMNPKDVLSPLHIKLGLISNFINLKGHKRKVFKHLKDKIPRLSAAKVFLFGHKFNSLKKNAAFAQVW